MAKAKKPSPPAGTTGGAHTGTTTGPMWLRMFDNLVEVFITNLGSRVADAAKLRKILNGMSAFLGEDGVKALITVLEYTVPPVFQDPGLWKLLGKFIPPDVASELTNEGVDEFIRAFLRALRENVGKPGDEQEAAIKAAARGTFSKAPPAATPEVNGLVAIGKLSEARQTAFNEILNGLVDAAGNPDAVLQDQLLNTLSKVKVEPSTLEAILRIENPALRANALFKFLAVVEAATKPAPDTSIEQFLKDMQTKATAWGRAFIQEGSAERTEFVRRADAGTTHARIGVSYFDRGGGDDEHDKAVARGKARRKVNPDGSPVVATPVVAPAPAAAPATPAAPRKNWWQRFTDWLDKP